jgi:hypothetical protein
MAPARPTGRLLDAGLELLDRQLVDADGSPAGKVDDLELDERDDGSLVVTAILTGPGALAPRLEGRLGRTVAAVFERLHPESEPSPSRVSFGVVAELGSSIRLTTSLHSLDTNMFEHWVRENLIGRIPGSGDAPE